LQQTKIDGMEMANKARIEAENMAIGKRVTVSTMNSTNGSKGGTHLSSRTDAGLDGILIGLVGRRHLLLNLVFFKITFECKFLRGHHHKKAGQPKRQRPLSEKTPHMQAAKHLCRHMIGIDACK
jgi:hypothetical protein